MDWSSEFSRYLQTPHDSWPQGRPLQADKLKQSSERRAGALAISVQELGDRCMAAARRRDGLRPPTLFLVNCGSSGSHWVEAMLAAIPGIHACGEVYVPPELGQRLAGAGESERTRFLDALHQVHMERPVEPGDADILINSAHSWNPHDLMGDSARAVLLVRDPLDVVVSRTFRKPKLRRHLAPGADDMTYLERNAAMVEKFYRSALRRKPATVVRYEDLEARPVNALSRLLERVGRSVPASQLQEIALQHTREAQRGAGVRLSNVYRGPDIRAPHALVDQAMERLGGLRADMGYG